jgi:hypothetical protein
MQSFVHTDKAADCCKLMIKTLMKIRGTLPVKNRLLDVFDSGPEKLGVTFVKKK